MDPTRRWLDRVLAGVIQGGLSLWLIAATATASTSSSDSATLVTGWDRAADRPWLQFEATPAARVVLEGTRQFQDWEEVGRSDEGWYRFPDLRPVLPTEQFYRVRILQRTAADDWKNQVRFPTDRLLSPEPGFGQREVRWIKFALLTDQPWRVWFQDSSKYTFHYDFAVARLPGFAGMDRATFDDVTLRSAGQKAVLGALLLPPSSSVSEVGIQLVGQDVYPRESVLAWFRTVAASVGAPPGVLFWYFPTFEQAEAAQAEADWFGARGVRISGASRWVIGDEVYAPGWTWGRLVFVPASDLESAYAEGRLRSEDILVVDAVPAEIPPVAGVITLTPATRNSHVAIRAQGWRIPFIYPADEATRLALPTWDGREVMLRAMDGFGRSEAVVAPLIEVIPQVLQQELQALRRPPPLQIVPKETSGTWHRPADPLVPADIRWVGGKAANFGVLRRTLPEVSPSPALALTFDLWDAFLQQPGPGGGTLQQAIDARLSGFSWPPDMRSLDLALAEVRDWIRDDVDFPASLKTAVLDLLVASGLPVDRKIRFRSSTNVEDSEQFTGAGLYDSYSGCLADDLDGDSTGPSACDPQEPRERGVFRALRRVYASFYNLNAFLERLRHDVDEAQVGMAVLVHESTPDPIEMANGVGVLHVERWGGQLENRWFTADLITQAGAVSVTNPDTTATPERVRMDSFGGGPQLVERSSLVPLGDTVLTWDSDYRQLVGHLDRAARGLEGYVPIASSKRIEFEYKKEVPGVLQVKQIRWIPEAEGPASFPVYLLGTDELLQVNQGEFGDLFSKHRLKSWWHFDARHARLPLKSGDAPLLRGWSASRVVGREVQERPVLIDELEGHTWIRETDATEDRWTEGSGPEQRRVALRVPTPTERMNMEGPLTRLADLRMEMRVDYTTSQAALGWEPRLTRTRQDLVLLERMTPVTAGSLLQERVFRSKGVEVRTQFHWPPEPTGVVAGYTAPLQAWVETRITGLTREPLVLRGPWSQTYQPGHHNFHEDFLFDPWLEPGLSADSLAELSSANIRGLVVSTGDVLVIWGLDDTLRDW
jgi:hypothetical protein